MGERKSGVSAGETGVQEIRLASKARAPDVESLSWVRSLSGTGPEREDAVCRLHGLLLRAAGTEVSRRAATDAGSRELDHLAAQAADEALVAILAKLHTYRGNSRFTTWAYKFALLETAVRLRRREWHGRELPLEDEGWARLADEGSPSPASQVEACELIHAVRDAIAEVLTPHERSVLIALTLNDVPIDVLAERRETTRGALYRTLHDGRRKLRARLAADGLATETAGRESAPRDADGAARSTG
jgi:RNA polymerase sigma-70 factor, ECF subfamily